VKGIWKDGRVRFRRDNNVSRRGIYGREPGFGRYSWCEMLCGKGRAEARRMVNKGARRQIQAEIESQLSAAEAQRIEEEAQFAKDMEELDSFYEDMALMELKRELEREFEREFERAYDECCGFPSHEEYESAMGEW